MIPENVRAEIERNAAQMKDDYETSVAIGFWTGELTRIAELAFKAGMERAAEIADTHSKSEGWEVAQEIRREAKGET